MRLVLSIISTYTYVFQNYILLYQINEIKTIRITPIQQKRSRTRKRTKKNKKPELVNFQNGGKGSYNYN